MSRETYVIREVDGHLRAVPKRLASPARPPPALAFPMIAPDIKPYRSIVTGEEITSRSRHREHLAAHGCEEVGNEAPPVIREMEYAERHGETYTPPKPADGEGTTFQWEDFDG